MNAEVQNQLALLTAEIMSQVEKVNEISCEEFEAGSKFLLTMLASKDIDAETKTELHRLAAMYMILHGAKHKCKKLAGMNTDVEIGAYMKEQLMIESSVVIRL